MRSGEFLKNRVAERWSKTLVRQPLTYKLLERMLDFWNPGDESRFAGTAARYAIRELARSVKREAPVVWASAFTPSELIYGVGAIPVLPEVASGFCAAIGKAPAFIDSAGNRWVSSDLCTFHRCALGLAFEGYLPAPDAVIATSHLCDGGKKFLETCAQKFGCPFFLIDVPYPGEPGRETGEGINYSPESLDYLVRQLESVLEALPWRRQENLRSTQLMSEAIDLSNRARRLLEEINAFRTLAPSVWSGAEALNYVEIGFMIFGSQMGVEFYSDLLNSLRFRRLKGITAAPREKHRLLWLHLRPYYPSGLFHWLESETGAVIAFEEYSHVYWPEMDAENPLRSIALKMLSNPLWGPLKRRVQLVGELCEKYDVDGVIHFSHWGCRQSVGGVSPVKAALSKAGIPFLELSGDCVDPRNGSDQQLRTRLEAYIEVMEGIV